jgi:hypothetical protein
MHAGWLVDMASLWAFHASTLIHQREPMSTEAVNEYWIRNRVRFDGWNAMLSRLRSQTLSLSVAKRVRAWDKLCSLIEEVLLSEPLARVSAAFAAELEERQIDNDSHSILHNVFAAHSEVRHRCLKIILEGIERGLEEAEELNRLRHYLEHWNDMLLGYFLECRRQDSSSRSGRPCLGTQYAFSISRVEGFAEDFGQSTLGSHATMVWTLQLAGCRKWLDEHCRTSVLSPKMHQRIGEASIGMIKPSAFDSLGCLRSRLIQSIEYGIDHADETIAKLQTDQWESLSRVLIATAPTTHMRFEVS